MARSEGKAGASQEGAAPGATRPGDKEERDPADLARRRRLELSRSDVERRLSLARAEAHREILRRALEALDAEIASLR